MLIGQGSRLAGSLIKAANDTAPLVINVSFVHNINSLFYGEIFQGIQEFTDQLPLITGFASAYAEVNAEQAQRVSQQLL